MLKAFFLAQYYLHRYTPPLNKNRDSSSGIPPSKQNSTEKNNANDSNDRSLPQLKESLDYTNDHFPQFIRLLQENGWNTKYVLLNINENRAKWVSGKK